MSLSPRFSCLYFPIAGEKRISHRLAMLIIGCLGMVAAQMPAHTENYARPDLVQEVLAGRRHEARASWWGFDANDSTKYLQQAIHSKVKRLVIDRQASPWISRPLAGVGHQEIILEAGVELAALKGAFRQKGDCLITFQNCDHVTLRGQKHSRLPRSRIRMHKADYQSSAYAPSEWRHAVAFLGCRNVLVQDLAIEGSGGDGIYLGTTQTRNVNRDVIIRRVDCNDNHRQGISVISAENLLIENCILRNTRGTEPQSGIDFEPNSPTDSLINCVMRNCVSENNAGTGYALCPQFMNSRSRPLSITLDHCISRSNRQHAVHLCSAQKDPPSGLLKLSHFTALNDGMAGLSVQFNPSDGVRIELEEVLFQDCAQKDTFFPPLYLQGVNSGVRPQGNIHFQNVTIVDNLDRRFFKYRDSKQNGMLNVTGQIILKRNSRKETIQLTDDYFVPGP